MKKIITALFLTTTLTGCALIDAYFMARYDNVEYSLLNKINTLSELSVNDCKDQKNSYGNFEGLYWTAVELRNFSQYIPRNTETQKLASNMVELTKQGKEMYEKGTTVSETFCKLKLGQINRSAKVAQEVIGKKPR